MEGTQFVVRQFFLRDYPEEKAVLHALAEILDSFDGLVTYNGKTFDVPLLETRYALARLKSPFGRLLHLDALHPSRRLWRLRLESCKLTDLESAVLGIEREGDVAGSEIPGIYFDYLRTGDARGLQPVFYHNALDIMTLAAVTVELARAMGDAGTLDSPVDLFSLSRMFEVAGSREQSVATCQRALSGGLPEEIEARALHQLALQYKRQRQHELAIETWLELTRRPSPLATGSLRGVGHSLRAPPARSQERDGVHGRRPRTPARATFTLPPCRALYPSPGEAATKDRRAARCHSPSDDLAAIPRGGVSGPARERDNCRGRCPVSARLSGLPRHPAATPAKGDTVGSRERNLRILAALIGIRSAPYGVET